MPHDPCSCEKCDLIRARWEARLYTRAAVVLLALVVVLSRLCCQYGH